jgi:hypothetical protein
LVIAFIGEKKPLHAQHAEPDHVHSTFFDAAASAGKSDTAAFDAWSNWLGA